MQGGRQSACNLRSNKNQPLLSLGPCGMSGCSNHFTLRRNVILPMKYGQSPNRWARVLAVSKSCGSNSATKPRAHYSWVVGGPKRRR